MPVPTRPSTGGPIESSWGQEAHDGVFTPTGGQWGPSGPGVGGAINMPLTAVDDPDGWLGADGQSSLFVPADGDGLYTITAQARLTVAGAAQVTLQIFYGALLTEDARYWGAAGGFVHGAAVTAPLLAGDEIRFRGAGAVTNAVMVLATITRIGRTYGLS